MESKLPLLAKTTVPIRRMAFRDRLSNLSAWLMVPERPSQTNYSFPCSSPCLQQEIGKGARALDLPRRRPYRLCLLPNNYRDVPGSLSCWPKKTHDLRSAVSGYGMGVLWHSASRSALGRREIPYLDKSRSGSKKSSVTPYYDL